MTSDFDFHLISTIPDVALGSIAYDQGLVTMKAGSLKA